MIPEEKISVLCTRLALMEMQADAAREKASIARNDDGGRRRNLFVLLVKWWRGLRS